MPNPANINIKNVQATYNVQTTLEDKIAVYIAYNAYCNRIEEISLYADDEKKKKACQQAGLPVRELTVEEENLLDELKGQLLMDILGDGSREAVLKGNKALALMMSKNAYDMGVVYADYKTKLMADNKDANPKVVERNALYLAYKKQNLPNALFRGLDEIGRALIDLMRMSSDDESYNMAYRAKMIAFLSYDKDMTMNQFMEKIGFKDYEKKLYLADMGCKPYDKVYDVIRNRLVSNGMPDNEITEEDVISAIHDEFVDQYSYSVYLESAGNQIDRFAHYYSDNMTVEFYLSLLGMDDKAKQQYYINHECSEDTKLSDYIMSQLTVRELSNIRGIDDKDYEQFLKDNNCKGDDKIKDTKIKLTVKEIQTACGANMEKILNTDERIDKSIQFSTILQFPKQFEDERNKDIYYKGRKLSAHAPLPQLPPKQNKTKEDLYDGYIKDGMMQEEATDKAKEMMEYQQWAFGEGENILNQSYFNDLKEVYNKVSLDASCKNPLRTNEDPLVQGFIDNSVAVSNTSFLRNAISSLEATGTGRKYTDSQKERAKNSTGYEAMLKALKNYYVKASINDREGIDSVKNTLREKCLDYIRGKETVRKRQFGRERFDIVMTILSDIMPKNEFNILIGRINIKRKVTKGHPDFLEVGDYSKRYANMFSVEEVKEEERQLMAELDFVTDMPDEYKERFDRVVSIYGSRPQYNDSLFHVFGAEVNDYFSEINEHFVPIGKGFANRYLSEKDFVAIAYGGSLTDEAVAVDKSCPINPSSLPYKALQTGKEYTIALMSEEVPESVASHASSIEAGRQAAAEAMRAYANGDKTKLAHVLGSGIRHIAAMCRAKEEVDESFYLSAEVGSRMIGMLDRDPELKQMIIRNPDYALMREDVTYIGSISRAADIYRRAKEAESELSNQETEITKARKTELLTDVMMLRVLNESKKMYHRSFESNERYKNYLKEALDTRNIKVNDIVSKDITDNFTIEDKNSLLSMAHNDYEIEKLRIKDLYHNDKLMTSINNDKSVTSLRKSVKDLVKDGGLDKLTSAEALERINAPKIISKLASMTGKADEKAATDWNNRVATEKRERLASIAAKKARTAKKAPHQ